jgi:hypothetical protein
LGLSTDEIDPAPRAAPWPILGRSGPAAENLAGMRVYVEKDLETALRIAEAAGLDTGALGEVARRFAEAGAEN